MARRDEYDDDVDDVDDGIAKEIHWNDFII